MPASGHAQDITKQIFKDLKVEEVYQCHAHLQQKKDVQVLVLHMMRNRVFDFDNDRQSEHVVTDLFCTGFYWLAGQNGGHIKHLLHYQLHLCTHHNQASKSVDTPPNYAVDLSIKLFEADELPDVNFVVGFDIND